jgi:hypothetical protein
MKTDMETVHQPLDYAPRPSRRRKILRRLLGAALIAILAFATIRWGSVARRKIAVLYWQHECLVAAPPADQVVYAEDPVVVAGLLRQGSQYTKISTRAGSAAGRATPDWTALASWLPAGMGSSRGAVLFMHERHTPSGKRRLVVVQGDFDPSMAPPLFIPGFDLNLTVLEPETLRAHAKVRTPAVAISVTSARPRNSPKLKIFAGQIDPSDPSHFTIGYEMYGQPGIVDGWLRKYDQVEIKVRTGPPPYGPPASR